MIYQLLHIYDEDFRELFKVQAQFTPDMQRNEQTAQDYALFVGDVVRRENLRHFDRTATARLLDEAARMADDQEKITTRFAESTSLIREASFWAGRAGGMWSRPRMCAPPSKSGYVGATLPSSVMSSE